MHYHHLSPSSLQLVEALLVSPKATIKQKVEGVLGLALHTPEDPRLKQELFERLLEQPVRELQWAAVQALGHLARTSSEMDTARARVQLEKWRDDAYLSGAIADDLDDLEMFGGVSALSQG